MTPQEKKADELIEIMKSQLPLGRTEIKSKLGQHGILMDLRRDQALIVAITQWFHFQHETLYNADQLEYLVCKEWKYGVIEALTDDPMTRHKLSRCFRKRRTNV